MVFIFWLSAYSIQDSFWYEGFSLSFLFCKFDETIYLLYDSYGRILIASFPKNHLKIEMIWIVVFLFVSLLIFFSSQCFKLPYLQRTRVKKANTMAFFQTFWNVLTHPECKCKKKKKDNNNFVMYINTTDGGVGI